MKAQSASKYPGFIKPWNLFLLLFFVITAPCSAELWSKKIARPVYPPDTTVTESDVEAYVNMSEEELKALVTTEGGRGTNVTMKKAARDLAAVYQTTGRDIYADRAVIILERFAEVIPEWPFINRSGGGLIPLDKVDWGDWSTSGFWGAWYHSELGRAVELPMAYDWISASGAIERRSSISGRDVRRMIEDDLLRYMVETNLKVSYLLRDVPRLPDGRAPFDFSNMGGARIQGIIPFGKAFEPEYIHLVVDWLRVFPVVGYFRDGIWHEGAPSYHLQITNRLNGCFNMLKGYSDPPGYAHPVTGKRLDNLDLAQEMERQVTRMNRSHDGLVLPNGRYLTIHDTHTSQVSNRIPETAEPFCLFGMRHAMFGRHSGDDRTIAFLHFGGTDGHEHLDCLNIGIWALGGELLSEGEYSRFGNRAWNTSTAGHNTVVIDERNQLNRLASRVKPGPDDSVDGLPFNPCIGGHGDTRNFGNLRLWDVSNPHIQVVEAEGENSVAEASIYRRTFMMVETTGTNCYFVDIFRVKGGDIHDWMLHGHLDEDYLQRASISGREASGNRFNYLELGRQAVTNDLWWNEFVCENGAVLRTTMMPSPGTEISWGRAPAQRRQGEATFMDVRRKGGDNLFIAVHEPYTGSPKIKSVTPLLEHKGADSAVCLRIELENGRIDYIAATLDAPLYREHRIPGTNLRFRGRLVHVSEINGKPEWAYLLEGSSLRKGRINLTASSGDFSHRGRITDVKRVEKGDPWDGFITTANLPSDGSLDGRTLLLTLGDGRTEGYTIAGIENKGTETFIHVNGEPGMELRDNGSLAKLVYYPWHGVKGDVNFLISGSVYMDRDGMVNATTKVRRNTLRFFSWF